MLRKKEMETCSICLGDMDENVSIIPGCRHRFHTKCLMMHCQYDVRCPVCRHTPEDVQPRVLAHIVDWHDVERELNNAEQEFYHEWEEYRLERRRVLRHHPNLQRMFVELGNVRQTLKRVEKNTDKLFDKKTQLLWKHDAELVSAKKERTKLRRRETYLDKRLDEALYPLLGPEPAFIN